MHIISLISSTPFKTNINMTSHKKKHIFFLLLSLCAQCTLVKATQLNHLSTQYEVTPHAISPWKAPPNQEYSLLHYVKNNDIKSVKGLLKEFYIDLSLPSKDNNSKVPYGYQIIHVAISKGHENIVNLLLQYDKTLTPRMTESENLAGFNAFHLFTLKREKDKMEILLKHEERAYKRAQLENSLVKIYTNDLPIGQNLPKLIIQYVEEAKKNKNTNASSDR